MNKIFLFVCLLIMLLLAGCSTNYYTDKTVTYTQTHILNNTITATITSTVTKTVTAPFSGMTTTTVTTTSPTTTTTNTITPVSYSIREALAQGLIAVKIKGYAGTNFQGVSSGDVITISFLRQLPQVLNIAVPMGTILTCDDSSKQDMVVSSLKGRDPSILGYYPVESIILNKDEWQEYLFEAYCMDITKSNIYNSTSFSLGPEAGQDVISMLTTANTIGPEIATVSAIQIALWALANDPSLDDLKERFNVDDQTIDNAWKILWEAQLYPSSLKMFEGYIPK